MYKRLDALAIARHNWLLKHPGILRRLAHEEGRSIATVSLIFNGHRHSLDGRIEKRFKELKAPGWDGKPLRVK